MPINQESLNRKLEKALKRYDVQPVDNKDEVIPLADEADAFKFDFVKDGKKYGTVYATLDDTHSLTIWYDDEVKDSPDAKTPGVDYDDTFTGLLNFMKRWAMNNQLSFNTDNRQHLGREMARRTRMKDKEKIAEGYYPMGKKASYNDAVPNVKIVLQHSRVMQEGEQRFRHIEKIFVENAQGERFLVPTTKPGLARVFARHIAEGGTPYDERAGHIQSLVEEYNKMAGFVRATRNGQFNESAQQLVQEGINHYVSLRESLGKMTGRRGYTAYFESWTPPLMEDETDQTAINELFVQETLDPRIESVMPILSRLHKQVAEMKEVGELSEWANNLLEGGDGMEDPEADDIGGDASDDLAEDEGLQSNNPGGIPEEEVEEGKPGLWANIHAKRERIKHGSGERMRKPGSKGAPSSQDFKDSTKTSKNEGLVGAALGGIAGATLGGPAGAVSGANLGSSIQDELTDEGLGDVAKKVGSALKKAGSKALDTLGHGSDEELLRALKKNAGVRNPENGKPSMAKSDVDVSEDLDADQKRVGQLGPTEKVGKKGAVGKLVGANENFISMASQAVVSEMDKSQTPPGRDDDVKGPEGKATPITPKKMADDAKKVLDKQKVKEGQSDLDRILIIMNHRR
jgi:hypothetical protein